MKIAIVDDNQRDAAVLKELLLRFGVLEKTEISAEIFTDSLDFADSFVGEYDAVFLDIEMPYLNGLELARRIRKTGSDCSIVFETDQVQYAVQGYDVEALAYLLKPLRYQAVAQALRRIDERLRRRRKLEVNIVVNTRQEIKVLPSSEILYIEVESHNLLYHTVSGIVYRTRESMKALEAKLADVDFCRCNSGYLVNLRHVDCIRNNFVRIGSEELLISRHKKKEFIGRYTRNAR